MEDLKTYTNQLLESQPYIRVDDFKQYSHLTPQDIYEIMVPFEKENKVTSVLETRCPHCGKWTGKHYEAFWTLPKEEECPYCFQKFGEVMTNNSYLVWENLSLKKE